MSTQDFNIYDSDQVDVIYSGIPIDSGRDVGEFAKITYESDLFTDEVGADGAVTRSKTNDRRATVVLTLMQASKSNAFLSALALADMNAPNGAGVAPILIKDKQGTSMHGGEKCWIQKLPDTAYGAKAGTRQWAIRCASLKSFIGGN